MDVFSIVLPESPTSEDLGKISGAVGSDEYPKVFIATRYRLGQDAERAYFIRIPAPTLREAKALVAHELKTDISNLGHIGDDPERGSTVEPRFSVPVVSDEPEETARALARASVPTLGPAYATFIGSDGPWTVGHRMTVLLVAESADAAEARVREVVGDGCEVGPAEPVRRID